MIVVAEFGDGDDEDAVVFACVTAYDAGAAVGTFAVGTYVFPLCRLIKVGHESAVEREVTHAQCSFVRVRLHIAEPTKTLAIIGSSIILLLSYELDSSLSRGQMHQGAMLLGGRVLPRCFSSFHPLYLPSYIIMYARAIQIRSAPK